MAELVDALRSGRSSRKGVEVRVLFWAPISSFRLSETVQKHSQEPAKAGFFVGFRPVTSRRDHGYRAKMLAYLLARGGTATESRFWMPANAFNDSKIRALKTPDRATKSGDGGGLLLQVA